MPEQKSFYDITTDVELLRHLEAHRDLRETAGRFLLFGGLLAGHSDGRLDDSERNYLSESLSPFMEDTESQIDAATDPEAAVAGFGEAMAALRARGGEICKDMFRVIAALVAADGVLDPDELKFMRNVAAGLGVPSEVARDILTRAFRDNPDSL